MKSYIVDRIRFRTTLEQKLQVSNEMAFISLITDLGYREDKMWTEAEDKLLYKLLDLASVHTKNQMDEIAEHKKMHRWDIFKNIRNFFINKLYNSNGRRKNALNNFWE